MEPYSSSPESEAALTRDVQAFFFALIKQWRAYTKILFGEIVLVAVLRLASVETPYWLYLTLVIIAFVVAAFHVWRDQHKAARRLELEDSSHKAKIDALRTPKLVLACGDSTVEANSRNRPVVLDGTRRLCDFLGFVLTNSTAVDIMDCKCDMTRLERDGSVIWNQQAPLPFSPRGDEFAVQRDVNSGMAQPVALCTITDRNEVLFGSLNRLWRFPESFPGFFDRPGKYTFTVRIVSRSSPPGQAIFEMDWTGERSTTDMRLIGWTGLLRT